MDCLSKSEIVEMRKVGRLAARTLEHAGKFVRVGISTQEIDQIVYDFTLSHGAVPAPLGYHGYPKSVCTSVNQVICHGVPNDYKLRDGDIINIDITSILNGFYGDTSATFLVGKVSEKAQRIVECARIAMEKGIAEVSAKATTGDIGFAINKYVTKQGYFVVHEIGGHGIGKKFHTDPFVPSFGKKGIGDALRPWSCITVEPMINETPTGIKEIDIPNSTVKIYETEDGCLSAQFEHTLLVTDSGYEIMTLPD